MYRLILENEKGSQLTFNQIGGAYQITDIDGLNPPTATINTSEVALMDGQKFNSSKLQMRTIQIAFTVEEPVEANRIAVFNVIKSKQPLRVYYENQSRSVFIDGYVQSLDVGYFDKRQIATVTILCPKPYWNAAQSVVNELSQIVSMFHFAFASTEEPQLVFGYFDNTSLVDIVNDGDVATGMVIELYAAGNIGNPKVIDYITGQFMELNTTMQAGDLVTIDTRSGSKSITLLRNAQTTNIFNTLAKGSTWLQLDYSGGVYIYEVGTGSSADLTVYITHYDQYEGV